MAITSTSNIDVIRQEVYSDFVLRTLKENVLADMFSRDVSDFGDGDTLNIPVMGPVTLQDVTENEAITYNPIESDRIQFNITDYKGDGYYATKKMMQDSYAFNALLQARAEESGQAAAENYATRLLETVYAASTAADPNIIAGRSRRIVGGNSNKIELNDFNKQKLAFDKANVPLNGRVAIVDPSTAYSLNQLYQTVYNANSNDSVQKYIEEGISSGMNYVNHLFGWTIMESNLLPKIASGTDIDGTTSLAAEGVANLFMCVADDQCKPIMSAWRQQPETDFEYKKDLQRDEWVTTWRYGLGVQRKDTLGVVVTETNV